MLRVCLRSTVLRLLFVTAALSLASGVGTQASAQPAAAGPDALLRKLADQYVPTDAQVAAFAATQTLLTREGSEMMPREVITAAGMKGLGFDPLTIDVVIGCTIILPDGPPLAGAVLHTSAPLPAEGLFPELKTEPAELAGKTYARALQPIEPSHCRVDDHTLIVAMEPMLQRMLAEKKASPLRTLLAKATLKNDVTAVAAVETLRPMIEMARQQMGEVPPPFVPLLKIPDHIEMAQLTFDLKQGAPAKLTLVSQSDENASKLVVIIRELGLVDAKKLVDTLIPKSTFHRTVDAAWRRQLTKALQPFLSALEVRANKNKALVESTFDTYVAPAICLMLSTKTPRSETEEKAEYSASFAKLRRIGRAIDAYEKEKGEFPIAYSRDAAGRPLLSWRVHLLPYLGEEKLFAKFHLDEPWDSQHNRKLLAEMPAVYEVAELPGVCHTPYVTPVSPYSFMSATQPRKRDDIAGRGVGLTTVLEVDLDQSVLWTKPQDWILDPKDVYRGVGGLRLMHLSGFMHLNADGSVSVTPTDNDPKTVLYDFLIRPK